MTIDAIPRSAAHPPGYEQLEASVAAEARRFERLRQSLTFRVSEEARSPVVQVVERGSGRVLREMPPKEFLDLAARLREMVGFLREGSAERTPGPPIQVD
ncbi:MAG TPA: flagellar protein FlaG [bacterium]|nr:flagellar protein FlaG [bacterium]